MTGSTSSRFGRVTGVIALALLAATAVAQPVGATYPAAANGRIVFAIKTDAKTNIYSMTPDGSDVQQLTDATAFDACPAASADGNRIAFCSNRSGTFEIWMMDADGGNQHQLTHTGGSVTFPDISPDGTKIAFGGTVGTDTINQIYVSDIDGGNVVALTKDTSTQGNTGYPVWSPDGTKIAFIDDRSGLEQVWVMNADGSNQKQLTTDAVNHDQVPDWSPDGTKIAYADGDGPGRVFVMNADGTNPTPLTDGKNDDWGPTWSPDGTQIAFRSGRSGPDSTIYLMDPDGSNVHAVLVPEAGKPQLQPAWLPLAAAAAQPSASN